MTLCPNSDASMGLTANRLLSLGRDGTFTLLLSSTVVFATAGVSLALPLLQTLKSARRPHPVPSGPALLIVLGKRLADRQPDGDFRERLHRALLLHNSGLASHILILGGRQRFGEPSEAQAGREWLVRQGVPDRHVTTEEHSRHTLENLRNARKLLQEYPEAPRLLITNRYHLQRSSVIAEGLGIRHIPFGAEERFHWSLPNLGKLIVESVFLHWYWVGKAWSRATRNRKSLAKIS